ncbi:hypothetical protein ACHAP8_003725 [Fusarium lateritium]
MNLKLPLDASELFEKAWTQHSSDIAEVLAYGLNNTTAEAIQQTCDKATETYAKEVLNWPHGRLAKPDIFKVATSDSQFRDLGDCTEAFVSQLRDILHSSPPKALPVFPFAFIAVDTNESQTFESVIVILAYKAQGNWRLGHCSIPIHLELGQEIESLRMGDITAQDILDQYSDPKQPREWKDHNHNPSPNTNGWAFALFSTGIKGALPLEAMIDPATDKAQPSEATLYLVADPENSQFKMSKQRMIELFPVIARDDRRRSWRTNNMRLHNKVFIYCDNDKPKENGIIVVRAEWDGDIDRNDEELKEAFGKAKIQDYRVPAAKALEKACELAEN